jgi:hypothetical protein
MRKRWFSQTRRLGVAALMTPKDKPSAARNDNRFILMKILGAIRSDEDKTFGTSLIPLVKENSSRMIRTYEGFHTRLLIATGHARFSDP